MNLSIEQLRANGVISESMNSAMNRLSNQRIIINQVKFGNRKQDLFSNWELVGFELLEMCNLEHMNVWSCELLNSDCEFIFRDSPQVSRSTNG